MKLLDIFNVFGAKSDAVEKIAIDFQPKPILISLNKENITSENVSFEFTSHGGGFGIDCWNDRFVANWQYHWRDGGGGGMINGEKCFILSRLEHGLHGYELYLNDKKTCEITLDGTISSISTNNPSDMSKIAFLSISVLSYFHDRKTATSNAFKSKTTAFIS